jgi:hypothetical protein
LIQPPKDSSLNKAIQEYKESQEEEESEDPNYEAYSFSEDRLEGFARDQLIKKIDETARDYIKDKNYCTRDIFEKMA